MSASKKANPSPASPLFFPLLYIYADLVGNRIFTNRMALKRAMDLPQEEDPFPQPVRFSKNRVAWDAEAVRQWVQRRINAGPRVPKAKPQRKNTTPKTTAEVTTTK